MGFEVTGTVLVVTPTKQVSDKFRKRELVIEVADNPKYPQTLQFEAGNDRCDALDGIGIGDTVRIEFNLRGRKWTSPSGEVKYFNSLDAWKVDRVGAAKTNGAPPPPQQAIGTSGDVDDGIPFASCDIGHEPSPIARVLR